MTYCEQMGDKLRGKELQSLVSSGSDEPVTVLIELDLPHPEVETRSITRGGISLQIPAAVRPLSRSAQGEKERLIAEGQRLLADHLHAAPRWLEAAGAFVATASPRLLLGIAASPVVKAIWPNRELHSPVLR